MKQRDNFRKSIYGRVWLEEKCLGVSVSLALSHSVVRWAKRKLESKAGDQLCMTLCANKNI